MADCDEQTIVINDLLSFVSCKRKLLKKNKLVKCLKEFYTENAADEALKTFLASLPEKIPKPIIKSKSRDSFINLCDVFDATPESELPVFVCRNLNNIPKPDAYESDDQVEDDELLNEQKFIKSQITEISSVVYQLKDQIQLLTQNSKASSKDAPIKRKREDSPEKKHPQNQEVAGTSTKFLSKQKGLAYLQKLIDEEEKIKEERSIKEEIEDNYSISDDYDDDEEDDFDDESLEEEEEDEQTLHLIANRKQRALVKSAENKVLSSNLNTAPFPKKLTNTVSKTLSGNRNVKGEKKPSRGKRTDSLQNEDNFLDDEESSIEVSPAEFQESDEVSASEKIIVEASDSPCSRRKFQVSPSSEEALIQEEKFPFIIVEQVFDENVGNFSIFKCSLCNFSTNDESAVQRHDCPQIYFEEAGEDDKDEKTKKSFRFFCLHCRFKCNSEMLFKKHTQLHPQTYPCPFCDEKFVDSDKWTEHSLICVSNGNRNPEDHVCQVCGIIYANPVALLVHRGFHEESRPYECLECRYRFYSQETLDRHFKTHSTEGFTCPFCHFVNKNKYTLSTHIRCHTGVMPFACQYCDYRSSSQSALSSHSLCHTDERPIKCDECPALFKSLHKLNSHKRTHIKDKTHKCTVCSKLFKTGWLMTLHHQRVHLNLRPHPCPHCSYKGRSPSALKSHLSTHYNEKAFKCSNCDFRANHKGYLNKHTSTCHVEKCENEA